MLENKDGENFLSPRVPLWSPKCAQRRAQGLKIFSILVLMVVIFLGFLLIKKPVKNPVLENIKIVNIAGQNVQVDLALTSEVQSQGLSGRKSLGENKGMLFVFSKSDRYAFWMKDMNFAIDMIWINEKMQVVYIKENALPSSYPEIYESENPAKYILEVSSGFVEKNNLKIGDKVNFIY